MLEVEPAEAAHTVFRREFFGVDHAREEVLQLVLVDDGEYVREVAVAANRRHAAVDDLAPVRHEPAQVLPEDVEGLDPLSLEPLDGVERNETDKRSDAKRDGRAVGKFQQVVEEI